MPIYEYQCQRCQKVFDVLQKFSDEPVKIHEGCGGAVQRVLTAPSFQFKGSGWYITDYGKSHVSPANGSSSSESTTSPSTNGSTSTAEKPAATSPATAAKPDSK